MVQGNCKCGVTIAGICVGFYKIIQLYSPCSTIKHGYIFFILRVVDQKNRFARTRADHFDGIGGNFNG
jgi:hypothetical protein